MSRSIARWWRFALVVMFLIHVLQREEEDLVLDCQQYCLEHLVNRLYQPELPADLAGRAMPTLTRDGSPPGAISR